MIKDISYAAYIIPFRERGNKKEFAILKYEGGYGDIGGRFDNNETDARTALRREITEELGLEASFLADEAIEIPTHEISEVSKERIQIRGAYREDHTFFIVKVPDNLNLTFCEKREEKIILEWLPLSAMLDINVTYRKEKIEWARERRCQQTQEKTR